MSFIEQMRNNDVYFERSLARILHDLGDSQAVKRFLSKYGSVKTKTIYISMLRAYFRWLKQAKGISMTPDEFIQDNLICVYRSEPTDVTAKRKHTDWFNDYVNSHMTERKYSFSSAYALTVAGSIFSSSVIRKEGRANTDARNTPRRSKDATSLPFRIGQWSKLPSNPK